MDLSLKIIAPKGLKLETACVEIELVRMFNIRSYQAVVLTVTGSNNHDDDR